MMFDSEMEAHNGLIEDNGRTCISKAGQYRCSSL